MDDNILGLTTDTFTRRDQTRLHKREIIALVKKLGEMKTLYKILKHVNERIKTSIFDQYYTKRYELTAYDLILMNLFPINKKKMEHYFTAWKIIIERRNKINNE